MHASSVDSSHGLTLWDPMCYIGTRFLWTWDSQVRMQSSFISSSGISLTWDSRATCISRQIFYHWVTWEADNTHKLKLWMEPCKAKKSRKKIYIPVRITPLKGPISVCTGSVNAHCSNLLQSKCYGGVILQVLHLLMQHQSIFLWTALARAELGSSGPYLFLPDVLLGGNSD